MKKFLKTVAVGFVLTLSHGIASADTTLTLSSWLPPSHPVVSQMIVPWTKQVEEATEGRVKINILAKGLGHPKVHYDIARDGLADITYSVHGYTPGRFLLTKVVEFPFSGNSAEALSVAYWRVHQKYLAKANEHKDTQLLSVFTHGPGMIHNSKKTVASVADLDGMKLRVGGGVVNDVATSLGAVPLLKPASASYELLSHGVADGTLLPMESVTAFKIKDIVTHTTMVPGGLYNISFFLVMNKDRFRSLSQQDQDAIMSVSGEAFSQLAGRVWDAADAAALKEMKDNGNEITVADDAFIAEIKQRTSNLESDWIKEAGKRGVDGAAALAELRQITASYNK
ncbi:TRAP-type C4-dicarboxylate transport system, substrate-binding protein [Amphritea atlantica]|uniref:TRAP-type C4-dicarboxylate transport system, substrate-binding protein n=1 Tax=Amphritea atlantica TaxID=355243 RepID=A0A1H9CUE3_9GAMM|nr:TRAP transporter substrate-binding protein [Amphritea atlantica]SEQ04198.1 TRAP-type C4-dicarboxylate transport system, substrate-binding protein [Amphritea atlantica]